MPALLPVPPLLAPFQTQNRSSWQETKYQTRGKMGGMVQQFAPGPNGRFHSTVNTRTSMRSPAANKPPCSQYILDVICGRGSGFNSHIGNIRFREMVKHFQEIYRSSCKSDKPQRFQQLSARQKGLCFPLLQNVILAMVRQKTKGCSSGQCQNWQQQSYLEVCIYYSEKHNVGRLVNGHSLFENRETYTRSSLLLDTCHCCRSHALCSCLTSTFSIVSCYCSYI
jgi:hypothetical protein